MIPELSETCKISVPCPLKGREVTLSYCLESTLGLSECVGEFGEAKLFSKIPPGALRSNREGSGEGAET